MSIPTLYTCARSRGLRATWAAEEAHIDLKLKMLPFPPRYQSPDYLKINPLGTVPMLVDGSIKMTESCAIAHYLVSKDGNSPLFVPAGQLDYAEYCDFTFHADATITFPQTVFMRFSIFEKEKGWGDAGYAYAKWFWKRLVKLEERLSDRQYLCAERFTAADICCGYALILAKSVGLDEGVPDSLKKYRDRLTSREGYKKAYAREESARKALDLSI